MSAKEVTMGFEAEVSKLLKLMIHSLYSNEEIFLRELIANSADAIDKLRFESLKDEALLDGDGDFRIYVEADSDSGTITIRDNGIGMTREEVIDNLGTIARSGTASFLEQLSGDRQKDAELIGQFGVGFYSSFIVADKVTVDTLKAGSSPEEAVRWESDGVSEYTVAAGEKSGRGTDVCLTLKPDFREYLNDFSLKNVISKYADHLSVPVLMKKQSQEEGEPEYETVNQGKALWLRSQSEISDDEYREFYHYVSHDYADPLKWSHNKVEGKLEYTSLLYIPSHAPFDLYNRDAARGLKLYVQRVFIMDDAEQFLPLYLRFVKGVIDSADLDLNVSREILQKSPAISKIRSALTRRVLDMLAKMAGNDAENYKTFWQEFGSVLKEGIGEDFSNREKVLDLLRMPSTKSGGELMSLKDYIDRMKEGQEKIYYLVADGTETAAESPHLEVFRKNDIEVLLFGERIDEWMMGQVFEYDGKSFQNAARGDVELPGDAAGETEGESGEKAGEASENEARILELVKSVLGDRVEDVKKTSRLVDSPACIVLNEQDISFQMRQILEASGQKLPETRPVFEVNLDHRLLKMLESDSLPQEQKQSLVEVLFDEATLAEGGQLKEPGQFIRNINSLLTGLSK